ncbi:unnamed protein product, partial [Trichogramma brassicae]
MVVRHPFERLLSAYRHKLENRQGQEYYYERFGKRIVEKYRRESSNHTQAEPTFTEFLNFIVDEQEPDDYWTPYNSTCYPCSIKYDYVMKFENLVDEYNYYLFITGMHKHGFPYPLTPLPENDPKSSTSQKVKEYYFKQVPTKLLHRVYEQNKSLRRLLHTLFFATPRAYNNAALFFFPLLLFSSCLPYNSSSTTASEYIYTRGRGKKKENRLSNRCRLPAGLGLGCGQLVQNWRVRKRNSRQTHVCGRMHFSIFVSRVLSTRWRRFAGRRRLCVHANVGTRISGCTSSCATHERAVVRAVYTTGKSTRRAAARSQRTVTLMQTRRHRRGLRMYTAVTSRPAACAHRRLLYIRAIIQEPGEFRIRRAKPYRPPGDHYMRDTYEPRYSARLAAADVDSGDTLGLGLGPYSAASARTLRPGGSSTANNGKTGKVCALRAIFEDAIAQTTRAISVKKSLRYSVRAEEMAGNESIRESCAYTCAQVHLGTRSIGACPARDRPAARDHLIRIANKAP